MPGKPKRVTSMTICDNFNDEFLKRIARIQPIITSCCLLNRGGDNKIPRPQNLTQLISNAMKFAVNLLISRYHKLIKDV